MGLDKPVSIWVTALHDLYVAEYGAHRIRRFSNGSRNGTVVAGTGISGSSAMQLSFPESVFVDEATGDLYVADTANTRIQLWARNATSGVTVSAAQGDLGDVYGIRLDNRCYIYVSDAVNSRVMRWPLNYTANGTTVAGGTLGSGPWSLDTPRQLDFDPTFTYLYVVDRSNHRVQRYNLVNTSTTPVTVAGGHGSGTAPYQLQYPVSISVARKSGALYISDTCNHRIQRWDPGSSVGVTIAGSLTGAEGRTAALLSNPTGIGFDANETFLYVADFGNNRVQRFRII